MEPNRKYTKKAVTTIIITAIATLTALAVTSPEATSDTRLLIGVLFGTVAGQLILIVWRQ